MNRLEVVKHSSCKSVIQDSRGHVVFTIVVKTFILKDTVTTVYRGTDHPGHVVAVLKGKSATFPYHDRPEEKVKHKRLMMTNSTSNSEQVFEVPAGELKWKQSGIFNSYQWTLVHASQQNRIYPPLLTLTQARQSDKNAFKSREGQPVPTGCLGDAGCIPGKGPHLNWFWTFSPEALDRRTPFQLLINGQATQALEMAVVALIVIAKEREERTAACAVGACAAVPMMSSRATTGTSASGGMGGGM